MGKGIARVAVLSLLSLIFTHASLVGSGDTDVADAAMRGDREALRSLIRAAADVNSAQGDGMTALHWAAAGGDSEMAGMLIHAGANVRAGTRIGGYTPLFLAAEHGHSSVIDLL